MELIADTASLDSYMDAPDFRATVRSAADFADQVKADLDPHAPADKAPGLLLQKARGLMHFRPGEVTVWTGYNGHRKSMMTSQCAIDLALQGERVLIVSLEMLPWRTMSRMTRQACGMSHPANKLIDVFHTWTNGKLWLFDHIGRIAPARALALCRYFADVHQGTHIVLDSWMMVCSSEENLDEQKQFSTDLCRLAQETGLHVHVVAHCRKPGGTSSEDKPPSRYDIRGSGAISDQAANVLSVEILYRGISAFLELVLVPSFCVQGSKVHPQRQPAKISTYCTLDFRYRSVNRARQSVYPPNGGYLYFWIVGKTAESTNEAHMRYLLLIFLALSMVGCAVYKPRTGNGPGYSELQIDANVYRVTLRGNGSTKPDQADEMALLRASELMLSKEFAYFMIADGSDSVESNSFTTPVQSSTRGYIQGSGSTARYSAKTTYTGGQTFNVHVPTVTKTVVGFKDRPTSGGIVYNSQQIFDSLAARYVQ